MKPSLSRAPLNEKDHVDFWYVQDLEAGTSPAAAGGNETAGSCMVRVLALSSARRPDAGSLFRLV